MRDRSTSSVTRVKRARRLGASLLIVAAMTGLVWFFGGSAKDPARTDAEAAPFDRGVGAPDDLAVSASSGAREVPGRDQVGAVGPAADLGSGRTPPIPADQRPKAIYSPDPDDDRALVGLDVAALTDAERAQLRVPDRFGKGVLIQSIHPDAPAVLSGLKVDDVIVRAQRTNVDSVQDLDDAVGDRSQSVLTVSRAGHLFHVVLHKPYIPPK